MDVMTQLDKRKSALKALTPDLHRNEPNFDPPQRRFTADYHKAFWGSFGRFDSSAALYEGSDSAGGYSAPLATADGIVPVPASSLIRDLAQIVSTTGTTAVGIEDDPATATAKDESGGSDNAFTPTSSTLNQKKLRAYVGGGLTDISMEAAYDAKLIERLATPSLIRAVQRWENDKFVNGVGGETEPEGILTGAQFGVANEDLDADRVLDLIETLDDEFHENAWFVMHRKTGVALRKQQMTAGVATKFWTRENGQDFLHGYPVKFVSTMPQIGQGNKVMVFGDFKAGYLIGDRDDSNVKVRTLDQPKARLGLVTVFAYRRTDGIVQRPEALKTFVIDAAS